VSIGSIALPNMYLNYLGEHKAKVSSHIVTIKDDEGKETSDEAIPQLSLNGQHYNDFSVEYEIDPKTGEQKVDGLRTQYVMSAFVTAMTDNPTHEFAVKFGLNRDALAVAANMTKLGVGLKTTILLLSHPIIKEFYWDAIFKNDSKDPGMISLINTAIKRLDTSFGEEMHLVEVTDEGLIQAIRKQESYEDVFPENIEDIEDLDVFYHDMRFLYSTLKQFKAAHNIKFWTAKLGSFMNLQKGVGDSSEAILKSESDFEDLGLDIKNDTEFFNHHIMQGRTENYPAIDVRKIVNESLGATSWQARTYTIYKEFTRGLLPAVLITKTPDFIHIRNTVMDNMTKYKRKISPRVLGQIEKDILSFFSIKGYMHSLEKSKDARRMTSLQNGFIYGEEVLPFKGDRITDVLQRVRTTLKRKKEKAKEKGEETPIDNYFLQHTWLEEAESDNNNTGVNLFQSNTFIKIPNDTLIRIQGSLLDLWSDPATRLDAYHIAHYVIVKDALQYTGNTILGAIPPVMFDGLLQQFDNVHALFKLQEKTEEAYRKVYGSTFPELVHEFLDTYLSGIKNAWLIDQMKNVPVYNPGVGGTVVEKFTDKMREEAEIDEQTLYIYADDLGGKSMVGQGRWRNLSNTIGIPIKIGPGSNPSDYFTDDTESDNIEVINEAIAELANKQKEGYELYPLVGYSVVFNENFLGTSVEARKKVIGQMKKRAPRTFEYLKESIKTNFGFDIEAGITKALEKSRAAKNRAVYIDIGEGELNADGYKNIAKSYDPITKEYKRTQRFGKERVKEGGKWKWKKVPAWKLAQKQNRKLKANAEEMREAGFKEGIEIIDTVKVRYWEFPLVRKKRLGDENQGERKMYYFKLDKVWTNSGKEIEGDFSKLIGEGTTIDGKKKTVATGNAAKYVMFGMEGSFAANPIGGIFGPRPPYDVITAFVEAKKEDDFGEDGKIPGDDDIILDPNQKDQGDQDYNDDTEFSEDVIDFSSDPSLAPKEAVVSEEAVIPEEVSVAEQNEDEFIDIGDAPIILLSDLPGEETYAKIEEFWYEYEKGKESTAEWKTLKEELKITNIDKLIEEYKKSDYDNEDKFIEHLRVCYLR